MAPAAGSLLNSTAWAEAGDAEAAKAMPASAATAAIRLTTVKRRPANRR
jgi:hypothetical protein